MRGAWRRDTFDSVVVVQRGGMHTDGLLHKHHNIPKFILAHVGPLQLYVACQNNNSPYLHIGIHKKACSRNRAQEKQIRVHSLQGQRGRRAAVALCLHTVHVLWCVQAQVVSLLAMCLYLPCCVVRLLRLRKALFAENMESFKPKHQCLKAKVTCSASL